MSQNKKSFWPYGILLSIFAIVLACVATIIFASQYPVYEDDSYLISRRELENNYTQIKTKEKHFNQNFILAFNEEGLKSKAFGDKVERRAYFVKESLELILAKKNPKANFDDLELKAKLTRPHTSDEDKDIVPSSFKDEGDKRIFSFALKGLQEGRWQLKLKFENNESLGFKEFELYLE